MIVQAITGAGVIFFIVAGLAILLIIVGHFGQSEYQRLASDFWRERVDQPFGNNLCELHTRRAAAKMRRLASEAVLRNPKDYEGIIARIGKKVALELACVDKGAAKDFVAWVDGAHLNEILYRKAWKAAWKVANAPIKAQPTEDDVAALRVLR